MDLEKLQSKWLSSIENLPFVTGIRNGRLSQSQRDYYIAQDFYYLDTYTSAINKTNEILNKLEILKGTNLNSNELDAHLALHPSNKWKKTDYRNNK